MSRVGARTCRMDTCPERHVLIMMMKVKDVLKLMMKVMKVMMLMTVKVVVKVFEEVLLFSLSSTPTQTTHPRTRPAALGLGLGR